MIPDKLTTIHFGLGDEGGLRSSIYNCYTRQDDYFIEAADLAGKLKISLHRSGICRFAIDNEHWKEIGSICLPERALWKWRRASTPSTGVVTVVRLRLATDYLRLKRRPLPAFRAPIFILPPAPPGHALFFDFVYSAASLEPLYENCVEKNFTPIFYSTLKSGDYVSILLRPVVFAEPLSFLGSIRPAVSLSLDKDDVIEPGKKLSGLSALGFNKPRDGEPLIVTEISGLTMQR